MSKLLALTLAGALALMATACGSAQPASAAKDGAPEVTITATEMAFSPATIELTAGRPVKLTLKNSGVVDHNYHLQAQIGDETILLTARPRQSASKTFTPTTPGEYRVICSIPGHEQAGMVGTVVVR